jgi:hypothetical protein
MKKAVRFRGRLFFEPQRRQFYENAQQFSETGFMSVRYA